MKKIIDIATGNKFVQWETLAQPIDDNFAELDETKLDKTSVSQSTGASTGTVMSQKAVTDALEKKIGPENLVQSTGNSTTTAMSQKAVTDALETYGANPSYTNYLVCNTADSVAVKTVTLLGFTLSNKVRLLIKMTSANVADNVSLSISSPMLDTKPLYYNGKRASSTNSWIAGAVLDVYYDGTNFMSTDIESSFVPVTGISDLINTGSATPEDIERILGTTDYQELKTLYGDKILIESQSTSFNVYGMSGFGNSTLGTIKIESLLSRASNYTHKGYIALSYAVGSLSIIKAGYIQLLEDAPKDGGIYGRKNGEWIAYTPTLYYTETKDAPVNSENYVTSEYPGDPYSSGHDYKIVRFTVAPGAAHTGPSFMLFDGDYNYYAKWPAIGLYPSSDHYFEAGSGYIPKERTPYAKIGATEQVHYKADTKKFYSITL